LRHPLPLNDHYLPYSASSMGSLPYRSLLNGRAFLFLMPCMCTLLAAGRSFSNTYLAYAGFMNSHGCLVHLFGKFSYRFDPHVDCHSFFSTVYDLPPPPVSSEIEPSHEFFVDGPLSSSLSSLETPLMWPPSQSHHLISCAFSINIYLFPICVDIPLTLIVPLVL